MIKEKIQLFDLSCLALMVFLLMGSSCSQKKSDLPASPAGYDINKPEKYSMPDLLQEISGFAFNKGNNTTVYAQQDEDGIVFKMPIGTKDETATKFSGKGDYEDVAISNDWVIVLKSNGTLFTFPLSEMNKEETTNVKENKGLIPKGEYEGMYADDDAKKVYVLCKTCKQDKNSKNASGYVLDLQPDGTFKMAETFVVDASDLDNLTGKKKNDFHPSALAKNPLTKEWYIVSSVNKALILADEKWKIKAAYHLSSNIYNQPEGIAFDEKGNLYISNEGSETQVGNILRFDYKKP